MDCSLEIALSWAINVKNSLSNVCGFSPYILVFGRNPQLPSVLEGKPPSLKPKTTLKLVTGNLKALHVAREAFIKSEVSEKIKRALKHNIHTSNDNKFFSGDKIYFKRRGESRWSGPGTVLGQDGQQILVKHGSYHIRVHPCRAMLFSDENNHTLVNSKADTRVNGEDISKYLQDNSVPEKDVTVESDDDDFTKVSDTQQEM